MELRCRKRLLTSWGKMPQKFCTLSCIEAFSMDRLPQSAAWQLWKMHGVFPLETDVHSVLISRCSHRPSLRLRSARTDAEVVEHDRSCECEMLMAVALNNWSDVFYSCHVFFFSAWKFQGVHELFMSTKSSASFLSSISDLLRKDYETKWNWQNWTAWVVLFLKVFSCSYCTHESLKE